MWIFLSYRQKFGTVRVACFSKQEAEPVDPPPVRLYSPMTNNGHLIIWTQIIAQSLLLFCERKDVHDKWD